MSKRLIGILTFAFVICFAFAAYAEVQNIKVSGDLTVYGIMRELRIDNNVPASGSPGGTNDDKHQTLASIVRLRVDADLTDNVMATLRLINERYWDEADTYGDKDQIMIDLAYATFKEFLYSPLTLVVGRQELHYGSEMVIGDPNTNNAIATGSVGLTSDPDLSMLKAFDAIKLILDYDPLVIDIVASKIVENTGNRDDDVSLYGVNANYALNRNTVLEAYYWLKETGRKNDADIKKGLRTDTIGARVVTKAIDDLTLSAEAAIQVGNYQTSTGTEPMARRKAWALELGAIYDMGDAKYPTSLRGGYAFFSGEKETYDESERRYYRGWDPMYENQTFGHIANTLFNQTNAHVLMLGTTVKATDDVSIMGDYYAFWWDKAYADGYSGSTVRGNGFMATNKKFAAQELDLKAIYDYTEDVQFGLLLGILVPGPAFNSAYRNTATELIGSMKVTF